MNAQKIEFPGHDGSMLAARLDLPATPPRAYALFAHCFTCGKDVLAASRISAALSEQGLAVLRFDFTGLGMSGGEFANTNFSSNVADLVCAADYLREHHQAPALLIGHSLGGAAVLAAAASIDEVRAVVTLAAPAEPIHVAEQLGDAAQSLRDKDDVEVTLAGRNFHIKRQFLEDLDQQNLHDCIAALGRALLVMHSPVDEVVDIDNARRIYEAARHPKSFVALDGATHLLGMREDAVYAARVLAAWVEHYLPSVADADAEVLPDGQVRVEETGSGKLGNRVRVGRHTLMADEPKAAGGDDAGPGPYDFLLAGLGACTSMTLRMYAEHKGLSVEHIGVSLRHESIHAKDCEDCESTSGEVLSIERGIEIRGELDPDQRQRMLEIADRCPVHRALTGEVRIRSHLHDPSD